MSDLERPPSGWWWNPDVNPADLTSMLANNKGLLVSLSVRAVNPKRLAAVWVAKGADDADAGWSEDSVGKFAGIVFGTDDIHKTYEELRSRGVEFSQAPSEQPWGTQAQFEDQDGNGFVIVQ